MPFSHLVSVLSLLFQLAMLIGEVLSADSDISDEEAARAIDEHLPLKGWWERYDYAIALAVVKLGRAISGMLRATRGRK